MFRRQAARLCANAVAAPSAADAAGGLQKAGLPGSLQEAVAAAKQKVQAPLQEKMARMAKKGQAPDEATQRTHMAGIKLHHPIPKSVPLVDTNAMKGAFGFWETFSVLPSKDSMPEGGLIKHDPAPAVAPKEPEPTCQAFGPGITRTNGYNYEVFRPLMINDEGKGVNTKTFQGASRSEPTMEYVEEPTMLYMFMLSSMPFAFSFWFLTRFV